MGEDWYRMEGIEVTETDRGGLVTYHGPGQLVGYPIVDLNPYGGDVHDYIRRMELVMISSLGDLGIGAGLIEGLTGVWVGGRPPERRKIGSIGVHVNRGVTTHGFAINVNNDLQPFEWIVPCGIEGCRMTSVCRELGAEQDMAPSWTPSPRGSVRSTSAARSRSRRRACRADPARAWRAPLAAEAERRPRYGRSEMAAKSRPSRGAFT